MNKREIINKIRSLESLSKDEKNYLVNIVNYSKQYGLVWENKPENVEEDLKLKLPILKEIKEKAIINDTETENYPNHILIEGDNLHTLTTLTFTHGWGSLCKCIFVTANLNNDNMKTKTTETKEGKFIYKRVNEATEFYCERCEKTKKAKITVKWINFAGQEKLICNGCYGLLLSKTNQPK